MYSAWNLLKDIHIDAFYVSCAGPNIASEFTTTILMTENLPEIPNTHSQHQPKIDEIEQIESLENLKQCCNFSSFQARLESPEFMNSGEIERAFLAVGTWASRALLNLVPQVLSDSWYECGRCYFTR